jgi:hypothetical protein
MHVVVLLAGWIVASVIVGLALGRVFQRLGWGAGNAKEKMP